MAKKTGTNQSPDRVLGLDDLFRKFLIRIRVSYGTNYRRFFATMLATVFLTTAIGVLVDELVPFRGIYNVLRSILLIPSAASIFALLYGISLFFHGARVNQDPAWIPYRARWSPAWRRRLSAVLGAILAVVIITSSYRVGYTFINSLCGAGIIALLAFIRLTSQEKSRADLGIPDAQDLQFQAFEKSREMRREKAKERKTKAKATKTKLSDSVKVRRSA